MFIVFLSEQKQLISMVKNLNLHHLLSVQALLGYLHNCEILIIHHSSHCIGQCCWQQWDPFYLLSATLTIHLLLVCCSWCPTIAQWCKVLFICVCACKWFCSCMRHAITVNPMQLRHGVTHSIFHLLHVAAACIILWLQTEFISFPICFAAYVMLWL